MYQERSEFPPLQPEEGIDCADVDVVKTDWTCENFIFKDGFRVVYLVLCEKMVSEIGIGWAGLYNVRPCFCFI